MANQNGWGDGSVNNNIGWGQGALNNNISWGKSQLISASGATDIDGGNAPANTVAPVISGNTSLGSVLTTTNGTWTSLTAITYTYQWYRGASLISGATNSTYTIVVADSAASITCQVTATNILGSNFATSNAITAQTFSAPVNTVAPAITGTAQEGQTLTCSTGTWTGNPTPTYTYQWKRNGSNIGSATNSTYTLVTADVGQNILCTVTATNTISSANADSNTVTPTSSTDADAQAFITAASITDPTQQSAINQLVVDLKGYNIWTKMKALYPFVGGTSTTHKYNLKDPRDLNAAFRIFWGGGVNHTSNGVTGNGMNSYGETYLNNQSILNNNNKHISIYQRNILTSISGASMGITNTDRFYLNYASSNYSTLGMNQSPYPVQTPQQGMFIMSKTASGSFKYFQNNLTPTTRTGADITSNASYSLLSSNSGSGIYADISTANIAFASIGDGLTDTEAANLYTAVQAFQVSLSRNV